MNSRDQMFELVYEAVFAALDDHERCHCPSCVTQAVVDVLLPRSIPA